MSDDRMSQNAPGGDREHQESPGDQASASWSAQRRGARSAKARQGEAQRAITNSCRFSGTNS